MYRYDNYTDSFVRIDGEPNTGSTTVRLGVPLKEAVIVKKVELTDDCIDKIAESVVRKLADRKTENSSGKTNNCEDEPQINPCDGCVCDDGKHLMYCMNCKGIAWKTEPPKVEDEPQTERSK